MSAVGVVEVLRRQQPTRRGLPPQARAFLLFLIALAGSTATIATETVPAADTRARDFLVLALAAAGVQFFAAHTPANQVFHAGLAFTIAAALLLPPELLLAVCVLQHLPEWLRQRYPWFIQTFNILNYSLSALAASLTWHTLGGPTNIPGFNSATVPAAAAAAAVFILVNHALLAQMLKLARGRTVAETGLFNIDGLLTDTALACIGIVVALTLRHQPALAALAAFPVILIHRALIARNLREAALKDHKTGLLNARGIETAAEDELTRASRFDRPLSLLLCDVDDLRGINNRHGHLAGDAALAALSETFCHELRDYDLCGRFGGDEFIIVLPETNLAEARVIATRLEAAINNQTVSSGAARIQLSISIGAATRTRDSTLRALIAAADDAMYTAKRTKKET